MTPMTVRGVPRGLQRDAWWMAADSQTGVGRGKSKTASRPVWLLVVLIAAFDYLVLQVQSGLGFVALILTLGAAAHLVMRGHGEARRVTAAWAVLLVSLIPAVDVVQFTSVVLGWLGLTAFAALLAFDDWGRAMAQLPFAGLVRTIDDALHPRVSTPKRADLIDWALPVGVGVVFVALFVAANPLMSGWINGIDFPNAPDFERIVVWGLAAIVIWPLLRLVDLSFMSRTRSKRATVSRVSLISRRSVMRALVVFNLVFALQTVMDLGYLWGGVGLPDAMSYATYAHRGAYPLMATALLAGAFALIAQPWLDGQVMRALMLVWVGQTMLLVMSSILRLDLYVDAYGLTHLRFAAFIWMIVVALGLVLLVLQILWERPVVWMVKGAAMIGLVGVYGCSLTNIAGIVAQHQLTVGPLDVSYVCKLGEGATVAVATNEPDLCGMRIWDPRLSEPADWREWGFRNARLRRSLDKVTQGAAQ